MADLPDSDDDFRAGPDRGAKTGLARWQKVVGVIGLFVVLGLGILMFAGGGHSSGGFGPGQHGPGPPISGTPIPGGDHEGNTPPIDGASEVAITADELAFGPDRIELTAGEPVNVALTSADIPHDLVVDELDVHLAADRDETVFGELVFVEPGTYVGHCSVPGHREAGMELEIVVTPSHDLGLRAPKPIL